MTKQDSLMVKGLAILMMLFLHLFNSLSNCNLCDNLIMIGDIPFVYFLSKAANPVAFFLFLSGYGLYFSNKSNCETNTRNYKRIIKLYIHFWFILTGFLCIGIILRPDKYPGSLIEIIGNYTSFIYSYNGEYWFLLPYAILAIASPYIFRLFERWHYLLPVFLTLCVNVCTSFAISRYGPEYLYSNPWLYNPLLVFHLLFPFTLGITCARTDFWGIIKKLKKVMGVLLWLLLVVLIFAYCLLNNYFTHIFYLLLLIMIFVAAPKAGWIKSVFIKLGEHSMNMWLIHTWLCYYLFREFIYGFKYPLLIYLVLILISYALSLIVNLVLRPVEKLIVK